MPIVVHVIRNSNKKQKKKKTKKGRSTPMNLPILLLLRPKSPQSPIPPLLPRNFNNHKPHEIRQRPITTMRAQHIQVLDIQRAPAPGEEVIELPVVVEEEHALFSDFFACEVVRLELDVGGEFCYCCWAGGGCCGGVGEGGMLRGAPAENAAEGLPEGG